jgi:hypothetical protein
MGKSQGKLSDSKILVFLNGLSLLSIVIILLIDKLFTFPGDMAFGIAMLPIALFIWIIWLWTYVADFVAIANWLAKKLGASVRKGFFIALAILPIIAYFFIAQ